MKIGKDKLKHFLACAIVSLLTSFIEACLGADFGSSLLAGAIAGIAIGVGKEYGDSCAAGNKWDWGDFAADMAGAAVGSVIGALCSIINH